MKRTRHILGLCSVILWLALLVVPEIAFAAVNITITDNSGVLTVTDNGTDITGQNIRNYIKNHTDALPSGNQVTVTSDAANTPEISVLYGTETTNGNATNNRVDVTNGKVDFLYGASSTNGSAGAAGAGNVVTMTGTGETKYVEGGRSNIGSAIGNRVDITNYTGKTNFIYGGRAGLDNSDGQKVQDNHVTITDSNVVGQQFDHIVNVVGGQSSTQGSNAIVGGAQGKGNTVTIDGGNCNIQVVIGGEKYGDGGETSWNAVSVGENFNGTIGSILGGEGHGNANATDNSVLVEGYDTIKIIVGGESYGGDANRNKVTVDSSNNTNQIALVIGGKGYGNVAGNQVTLKGGYVKVAHGGESTDPTGTKTLKDNTITIAGDVNLGETLHGALAIGNPTASFNADHNGVIIESGTLNVKADGKIYGAYTPVYENNNAENNYVTVTRGNIVTFEDLSIYGAISSSASKNSVLLNGGTLTNTNADKKLQIYGCEASFGDATYNSVNLIKGTITSNAKTTIFGGYSDFDSAINNTVNFTGGTLTTTSDTIISGGYCSLDVATNNNVNLTGGTLASTANTTIYGGSGGISAINNTVNFTGGTLTTTSDTTISGGYSYNGNATSNTVNLASGTVASTANTTIAGGYSRVGDATNNTFNLGSASSRPILDVQPTIMGGYAGAGHDAWTGNTLNVYQKGYVAKNISNFENINFYLPSNIADDKNDIDKAVLKLTDEGGTNLSGTLTSDTKIKAVVPGDTNLAVGDSIYLVYNPNGMTLDRVSGTAVLQSGVSAVADAEIQLNNDNVALTVNALAPSVLPQTKSLVETRATQIALLNGGSDVLAGEGLSAAAISAGQSKEFEPFFALSTSKRRYETGSHVDMRAYHLNAGLARSVENKNGKLLFGPLVEYGKGNYDSYIPGVHASGETSYIGGGVFARQENDDGLYYESSFRAGNTKADYSSNDLAGAAQVRYDVSSPYIAAHLGVGKVFSFNGGNELDLYGRYSYSHQYGTFASLSSGERYHFQDVDSHRLRIGGRFTHKFDESSKAYINLAYEYEFSGSAKAETTVMGTKLTTPAPSLKGGTGIMELGYEWKPAEDTTLDLHIGASAGKAQGWHGTLSMSWAL